VINYKCIQQGILIFFLLINLSCSIQQTSSIPKQVNPAEIYPVDRAHEDGNWTVLERVMPWGEAVIFLVPNWWMPSDLKDHHLIKVTISQKKQSSSISFNLINP